MSINWAAKQASIEARTAKGDNPKTLEKVPSSMGELEIAGAAFEIKIINIEIMAG